MNVCSRLAALAACALIGLFLSRIEIAVEPARVVILKSQSADPLIDELLKDLPAIRLGLHAKFTQLIVHGLTICRDSAIA